MVEPTTAATIPLGEGTGGRVNVQDGEYIVRGIISNIHQQPGNTNPTLFQIRFQYILAWRAKMY